MCDFFSKKNPMLVWYWFLPVNVILFASHMQSSSVPYSGFVFLLIENVLHILKQENHEYV